MSSALPLLLVVSFDGLWAGYKTLYADQMTHFRDLAGSGVSAPHMRPSFATKTLPNHWTISTGRYEETHQLTDNHMFDADMNQNFTFQTTRSEELFRWLGAFAVPVWISNEMERPDDAASGLVAWPMANISYPFAAGAESRTAKFAFPYSSNETSDEFCQIHVDVAIDLLLKRGANCVFLYHNQPDSTGHLYGPFSSEMRAQIGRVDACLGHLLSRIAQSTTLSQRLNLVVLSDHGMSQINGSIDLSHILKTLPVRFYINSRTVVNVQPLRDSDVSVIVRNLSALRHPGFRVFAKADIPPVWHYAKGRRVLAVVLFAKEGWQFIDDPSDEGGKGNHGYNNSRASMEAVFYARGPAFVNAGFVSFAPVLNIDMYPLFCHILRLRCNPTNGSLARMAPFLADRQSVVMSSAVVIVCVGVTLLIASVFVATTCRQGYTHHTLVTDWDLTTRLVHTPPDTGYGH